MDMGHPCWLFDIRTYRTARSVLFDLCYTVVAHNLQSTVSGFRCFDTFMVFRSGFCGFVRCARAPALAAARWRVATPDSRAPRDSRLPCPESARDTAAHAPGSPRSAVGAQAPPARIRHSRFIYISQSHVHRAPWVRRRPRGAQTPEPRGRAASPDGADGEGAREHAAEHEGARHRPRGARGRLAE